MSDLHNKVKALRLDSGRRAQETEPQKIISSQRSQIDKLKQENQKLYEELLNENSSKASICVTNLQQDRIEKLNELIDNYSRKVDIEGRHLESIQQELELAQAKLHEFRKASGGATGSQEQARQAAKYMVVLENRLQQSEQRFGETLAKNRELRTEIESLNKQRETFDTGLSKVERELQARRTEVQASRGVISIATEAQRVASIQLEALKAQADKEQALYDQECRELATCLENDQKLLEAQAQRLERLLGSPSDDDEVLQQGRVCEEPGGPTFQDAVQQLAEAAHVDLRDLPGLVQYFSLLESRNFSAFNVCNEANERISIMQKQIRAMQNEVRQAEVEGVLGRQKEVIRQTLTKRDTALKRKEALEDKRMMMERRLSAVNAGVSQVLKSLGCKPLSAAAGNSSSAAAPPSSDQVQQQVVLMQALGQLEGRARAIVTVWSTAVGKGSVGLPLPGASQPAALRSQGSISASREERRSGTSGPHPEAQRCHIHIQSAVASSRSQVSLEPQRGSRGEAAGMEAATFSSRPRSPGKKYGNKLFNDSESDSEDEAPLTRDQIQSMRMADGTSGGS
ncbi:hypothetical protein CEUSTIGMA_g1265.t1 [Chlamydomonas eustigma]|uniref:ODAD1 central coiled coil region domain-containing protein n=1 Tax=Chlamydomonas eustigma TaxID=1157962 RepID=A0A250WSK6_9CHLO|nr:hypothetical protein CEUSTIGMA_g1265.t1 [Chlamydomonas eustigma]|eukprot:GAX73814.1 hypothetical protein CEUSTIGMA_g1265.t1 [Chlamydomonas eustigma]